MEPLTIGILVMSAMLIVVVLGLPVGYALLGAGTIGYAILSGPSQALTQIGLALWDNGTNFLFIAVPLFILMGQLIFHAGLAEDIFSLAQRGLRRVPGGLGVSTVLASAGFGAVTGSSVAAVATMGNIAVPQMIKRGYSEKLSTATVASAATLAIIIPPSVPLVIYGVWSETSIGALFIAGIVPGLILTCAFIGAVMVQRSQYPAVSATVSDEALPPLSTHAVGLASVFLIFVIVIGGIYAGIFTPTEASGIGVFSVLAIALVGRRLTLDGLRKALKETLRTTAAIFLILTGGIILSRFLVQTRLTDAVVGLVSHLDASPQSILIALALVYLFLGAIMDTFGMLILTLPLVLPITMAIGYDPIWTGIYLTVLMEIAMLTPPIGLNVFVLERATGVPAARIFAGIWPFVAASLTVVLLLIYFPQIATWLPETMR
ncbi:TRAP transporter large permease [Aquamicrobium sp. LC103]|uniref:TRAP transporter large permease n=1 Tax=Aquamicrobium sp. LC103 TaxID=1120658 RepID=UPI00063E730A|nr:TRAP transporter large permease [Aquamicrobium sp. LC103]TKT82998.1 TRAP transporter large permease [Aquamicrobium sp. LC103]